MKIKSVFGNKERIPEKYTCDGKNISPPLEISELPEETKSLVLIVEDPDAPYQTFVHWVVWNIEVNDKTAKIEEGKNPGIQGFNSADELKYFPPCPPSGTHRYFFKIYALNKMLNLEEGATRNELEEAMTHHLLEKGEIIGLYSRN
jgi:Raf kinase inhibitor-like YbhB/YbcL family protein